jgi:2-phosphoglycerate kinase
MIDSVPYPYIVLRGRLRLIGLSYHSIERIILQLGRKKITEKAIEDELSTEDSVYGERFALLKQYDEARRGEKPIEPIVLVLEGASATGKSMLALTMINNIGATRIISTDTVRQVLRSLSTPETHPELYCHTYQAYEKRQVGSESLDPVVRGYLAQCEHIVPAIEKMALRIVKEGAEAVFEGVHVIPGSLSGISESIIEILINPAPEMHRNMFLTKRSLAGLQSVSSEEELRVKEYEATRKIQDFMLEAAYQSDVNVLELKEYDRLEWVTNEIILEKIKNLLDK